MKSRFHLPLSNRLFCLCLCILMLLGFAVDRGHAQTTVTIDTGTAYQTIRGWGCVNSVPEYLTPEFRQELINEVVDEWGLNRVRCEIPAGNTTSTSRWEWLNDNSDSLITNWSSLNLAAFDARLQTFVLPFANRVRANGEPFDMYVSYSFYNTGSSGRVPAWLLNNPGEYTEFAMSILSRLKFYHEIEPNYICILNEPTYDNDFTLANVRELIKTLSPKMEAAGFDTKIEFPEALSIDVAYNNFILPTATDGDLWSWVGVISYHRYGGTSQLDNLAAFANSKGLPTAFTEILSNGLSTDLLYTDLTSGMVSYWETYALASQIVLDNQHFNYFEPGNSNNGAGGFYWRLRQVMHYVRPGAVRVKATSDVAGPKLLAWLHNGKITLNFWSFTGSTVTINGLAPGTYGLSSARLTAAYVERGVKTVGADGTLTLTGLDSAAMYTLYPRGSGNLPPVFTSFKPSVPYLALPSSSFTLSAAAQDPDLNTISYRWAVTKAPSGASVSLGTPNAASCAASGLGVAGDYAFSVIASDGAATTQREVRMRVYPGNPPPDIWQIHNRTPVQLNLPSLTSTTLRSSVFNVDNDALTYQWSIVSQPPGADAQFSAPTTDQPNVTGMSLAGNYVFRLTVSDGTTTVSKNHTVPVYPATTAPAVSAAVNPSVLTLPTSSVQLSSTSSDADGDALSHWWCLTSGPAGANPRIVTPTLANTSVTGLIVPGTYGFQHVVTDQFSFKNSSVVSVTVAAGASPKMLYLSTPNGGETYRPGQKIQVRWNSSNFSGNVKLEFFDGTAWSTITASTSNDGIESWTVPTTPYSGCKVRVSDAANSVPADESDAAFRIVGPDLFKSIRIDSSSSTGPTLEWTSLPGGYSYQVCYSDTLAIDDWHPVGAAHVAQANEYTLIYTDSSAIGKLKRFYKVVQTRLE